MTKLEPENISDVVAEMREHAFKWAKDPELAAILERYANRVEAASEKLWDDAYTQGFDDRSCN